MAAVLAPSTSRTTETPGPGSETPTFDSAQFSRGQFVSYPHAPTLRELHQQAPLRTIVCDLDGTLVVSHPFYLLIQEELGRRNGFDDLAAIHAFHYRVQGKPVHYIFQELHRLFKPEEVERSKLDGTYDQALDVFIREYERVIADIRSGKVSSSFKIEAIDGIREVLEFARDKGIPVAIATTTARASAKFLLKNSTLWHLLKDAPMFCAGDIAGPSGERLTKNTAPYWARVFERLGVNESDRGRSVLLEDHAMNGIGAVHAGMGFVFLRPGTQIQLEANNLANRQFPDRIFPALNFRRLTHKVRRDPKEGMKLPRMVYVDRVE